MKVITDDKLSRETNRVRFAGSGVLSSAQAQDADTTVITFADSVAALGFKITGGTGVPSSSVVAGLTQGDMYWRLDGNVTATTTLYRLNTLTATTASWTALA